MEWMHAAAREIARRSTMTVDEVVEVLERRTLIDPAYRQLIPVPRCDGCKHWARPDPAQDGWCRRVILDVPKRLRGMLLTTSPDFGCVRWEAK